MALDGSGITLLDSNLLYVADIVSGEIAVQKVDNAGCFGISHVKKTKDWLVFSCQVGETYLYQNTTDGYKFVQSLPGRLLFLNPQSNTISVYDQQNYFIQTFALQGLSLLNTVPRIADIYQTSDNSLVLVKKYEGDTGTGHFSFLRLGSDGQLIEESRIGDEFINLGSTTSGQLGSSLYEVGDKIFRAFDYWQKNEGDEKYYFKGNDWQYKLGLSTQFVQSFPAANGFVAGNNGMQIWFADQGQMPTWQGNIQFMSPTYENVPISRVTEYSKHWWFAGVEPYTQNLYLKLWHPSQQFPRIIIPEVQNNGRVEQLFYDESTDSLVIAMEGGDIVACSAASALHSSTQCRVHISPRPFQSSILTRQGVLLFHLAEDNTKDATMYHLTTSGLQPKWSVQTGIEFDSRPIYLEDKGVLIGNGKRLILEGSQQGTVGSIDNSGLSAGCGPIGPQDILCTSPQLSLFRYSNDLSQALKYEFSDSNSPFHLQSFFHIDKTGQALLIADNVITQHQLDLPTAALTGQQLPLSVLQDESLMVDANQLLSSLSGVNVDIWMRLDPSHINTANLFEKQGEYHWRLNTKNEFAKYNPTVWIQLQLRQGPWYAAVNRPVNLINVNDPPTLKPGSYVNNLEVGESYFLAFIDVFEDIDGDQLTYTHTVLPEGFVMQETGILATPKSAGQYQFTLKATDPSGESVSATFSGTVTEKPVVNLPTPPAESSSGSGGSVGWGSLLALLILALWRKLGQSQSRCPAPAQRQTF
ncbi:putative Ig domain-containing protein [Rheinheimera sp.]|uniref:putative Ig domain-containing protein n=1 Tax=Rheinheimera sp. TaxID=1869214 RepID=UPI00307DA30C